MARARCGTLYCTIPYYGARKVSRPPAETAELPEWLDDFMVRIGYRYVRPRERSIVSTIFPARRKGEVNSPGEVVDRGVAALRRDAESDAMLRWCGETPFQVLVDAGANGTATPLLWAAVCE